MQNLLSIIIPSYNRPELLVDTITKITDSFKTLNFDDYQIVVVNSGVDETNKKITSTFDKNNFKQGKLILNNPSATERTFEQFITQTEMPQYISSISINTP